MGVYEQVLLLPTRQELKRVKANVGAAYPFLERLTMDMYHKKYDFEGDLIPGDATTPGTFLFKQNASGTIAILADQINGVARMTTTGATANDYCNLHLPNLNMQPQLSPVVAVRLKMPSIDDIKIEVGFTDDTSSDVACINDLGASPVTFHAADFAVWAFDTNDTGNATGWQGVSAIAGTISTTDKIEPTSLNATYPTAGAYQTLVVALQADANTQSAKYFILDANGYLAYESAWTDAAITYDDQLSPFVGVTTRTTGAKTVDIDYIEIWQRRTVA